MKIKYGKFFPFIALLLGVVASAMVLLPVLKFADSDTTYTGVKIIGGFEIFDIGPIADGKVPFCFLALLAFSLPLIGGIIGILSPKGFYVSTVLFVLAALLLFLLPVYVRVNVTTFIGGTTEWDPDWVLQIGAILAGSFSVLAGFISLLGFTRET